MTFGNELKIQPLHAQSVVTRMIQGSGVALLFIVIFLAGAGEPDPNWPKLWIMKPLLVVSLAGALGGLFYFNMDHLRYHGGKRKVLANILSLVVYVGVVYLGVVLGLNGTMWD